MGNSILSRNNSGGGAERVGDIRLSTRDSLGEKWVLAQGQEDPTASNLPTPDFINASDWKVNGPIMTSGNLRDPIAYCDAGDGIFFFLDSCYSIYKFDSNSNTTSYIDGASLAEMDTSQANPSSSGDGITMVYNKDHKYLAVCACTSFPKFMAIAPLNDDLSAFSEDYTTYFEEDLPKATIPDELAAVNSGIDFQHAQYKVVGAEGDYIYVGARGFYDSGVEGEGYEGSGFTLRSGHACLFKYDINEKIWIEVINKSNTMNASCPDCFMSYYYTVYNDSVANSKYFVIFGESGRVYIYNFDGSLYYNTGYVLNGFEGNDDSYGQLTYITHYNNGIVLTMNRGYYEVLSYIIDIRNKSLSECLNIDNTDLDNGYYSNNASSMYNQNNMIEDFYQITIETGYYSNGYIYLDLVDSNYNKCRHNINNMVTEAIDNYDNLPISYIVDNTMGYVYSNNIFFTTLTDTETGRSLMFNGNVVIPTLPNIQIDNTNAFIKVKE